ncbi:MAG: FkbM family methyltransferase [Verrucomicrobiae bacterium]|nr:FkbM family methyltransferase [Verrucomicrobiae bacterium]
MIACGAGAADEEKMLTVDAAIGKQNVQLLMIDTDGHDLSVLRGAGCVLRRSHPVAIVEVNDACQAIFEYLESVGYSYFIDMSNERVVPNDWPVNVISSTKEVHILGI